MKKKIVIASVLKPVDDTRMFEKFGLSLSQTNKYEVNIIGFSSKNKTIAPEINFYPLFHFNRLSLQRFTAPLKYYKFLLKVRPDIIIVNSYELLIVSITYKILFGTKLLYDVQENYFRNILYSTTFPLFIRPPLAGLARSIEWFSKPFVNHYFLAEKGYKKEFSFHKGKSTVIENKYKRLKNNINQLNAIKNNKIRFLYSGTIAENYGILQAIQFTIDISKIENKTELLIIGYCASPKLLIKIKEIEQQHAFISLIGGDNLVPHPQIINAITTADYALLPYQLDKSIENCFPTKIYEYMAHQLPLLIQDHQPWKKYCDQYDSCIAFDFNSYDPDYIFSQLIAKKFYTNGVPSEIFWENEELTFLNVISSL